MDTNTILFIVVSVLVIALFLTLLKIYSLTGIYLIPSSQAKRLLQSGMITKVIDVRTQAEYEVSHYPNSINIPVHKINKNSTKDLNKESHILIYCNTGQRARYAVNKMRKMGFKNVFYIDSTFKTLL